MMVNEADGYKFAVTQLTDADDPYWDFMNGDDSDSTNLDDATDNDNSDDSNVDSNNTKDKFPIVPIIIGAVVVLAGVIVITIILIKKHKKQTKD